ncbi:MAG: hypothetical protein JO048_05245 [Methylobacteriaceae bacterium]|nr:hypothetical protein [Methylobacteriaceae bacterium]
MAERTAHLLDRVDIRLADTDEEREDIYRLRYEAYLREGAIGANAHKMLHDHYDELDNTWIFGLYLDDVLASSIRMHVTSEEHPVVPGLKVFGDFLEPEIRAGKTVLDPTRFVTDHQMSRQYPGLAYVTLRLCWMAAEYFDADHFLATVRAEHQAFYRRTFGHRPICEPRPYPSLTKPITLMSVQHEEVAGGVLRRYPFFRSTFFERRMMFERFVPVTMGGRITAGRPGGASRPVPAPAQAELQTN